MWRVKLSAISIAHGWGGTNVQFAYLLAKKWVVLVELYIKKSKKYYKIKALNARRHDIAMTITTYFSRASLRYYRQNIKWIKGTALDNRHKTKSEKLL